MSSFLFSELFPYYNDGDKQIRNDKFARQFIMYMKGYPDIKLLEVFD
jgi:hypothetical protein